MLWFNAPGALLSAQEQTFYLEEWHATEGEQAESLDRLVSISDASSNLYVAGSQLNQYGKYDLLLTKYDNTGYELWSTTFNLADTTANVIVGDMTLDNSGNIIIAGTVYNGASNNYDALTLKYNASGAKLWHKTYNGAGSFYDGGTNIYTDFSNNIYIAGGTASLSNSMNMLCIKYNSSGTQQWAQSIDGYGLYDVAGYVYYRTASTVILVGAVQQSAASWAVGSLTLNTSTCSVATSLVISEETDLEEATAIAVDENGKIYVAGYSNAGGNGKDFVTLKLSSTLILNWEAVYDGSLHEDDAPKDIAVDGSGNVYVAGFTTTANGKDFTVIKYNSSGAQQWAKLVDGAAGQDDEAWAITVDGGGNAVAAGYTTESSSRDFYTTILDPSDGSTTWSATFNGLANKHDEASQVMVDSTGSIIVLGKGQTDHPEVTAYTTVRYAKRSILLPHETEDASTAISFVENRGQLADTSGAEVTEVRFYNTSAYPATYFQNDRLSFVTAGIDTSASTPDTLHRVDMAFKNGKNDARVFGLGKREAYHNYYLGHIPEGRARVGLYERAVQTDIYNKIDLEFYSNNAGVKFYFVIKPGGNPADIQLDFEGQSSLSVDGNEALVVGTSVGAFSLPQPKAYQINSEGEEVEVNGAAEYVVEGDTLVRFGGIGEFDEGKHLVIEVGKPGIIHTSANDDWVTYFGEASNNDGIAIDVGPNGDIAVLTIARSTPYPTITGSSLFSNISGLEDAAISVFASDRSPLWGSFFGGSSQEEPTDVSFNSEGAVYIIGHTSSSSLPPGTFPAISSGLRGQRDGFVARFNPDGTELVWSSFLGGDSRDFAYGIDVNSQDHVFIVGQSEWQQNFPAKSKTNAYNQAFAGLNPEAYILEFGPENDQMWGSFFGGSKDEAFADIVINDENDDIFILGQSSTQQAAGNTSPCPPPTNGTFPDCNPGGVFYDTHSGSSGGGLLASDLIIVQFNSAGQLKWSTYLGGTDDDEAVSSFGANIKLGKIAFQDGSNDILAIIGNSQSCATFSGHEPEGYFQLLNFSPIIARFENRILSSSTCFNHGGGGPYGIALGPGGNVYIAGATIFGPPQSSSDFCLETSGNVIPICPPASGAFFQDDDVTDGTINGPQANGGQEIFISAFDGDGTLVYSTLFGGNNGEVVRGLKIEGDYLYMTGNTTSNEKFPLIAPGAPAFFDDEYSGPGRDAFIAQLNISNLPTSLKEQAINENRLLIFPNPTSNRISVSLEGLPFTKSRIEIQVFDGVGRLLSSFETQWRQSFEADLSSWSDGIYLIVIRQSGKLYSAKVVKH